MMSEINHSERAHALLSCSSSSRWLACSPSGRLEDMFPEEESSTFAEEGTVAHELAQVRLTQAYNEFKKIKQTAKDKKELSAKEAEIQSNEYYTADPQEMEAAVQFYVEFVMDAYRRALEEDPLAELYIERRVDMSAFIPKGFGAVDSAILSLRLAVVIDFKYGKGYAVQAYGNPQMRCYGVGILENLGFNFGVEDLQLTIVQPRKGNVSTEDISAEDLERWAEETLKPRAQLAFFGEQVAGDHCNFCNASAYCKKRFDESMNLIDKSELDVYLIKQEELRSIYDEADRVIKWLNSVKAEVLSRAKAGTKWEGLKLVETAGNRKITDDATAVRILMDNGYSRKDLYKEVLVGFGDMEKLVGKAKLAKLLDPVIVRPTGPLALVPETDPRPEHGGNKGKFESALED